MNCQGVFYLMIPVFMFFLAKRREWRGVFQFLIPHCVTLSWLQICIMSSQSATTFGLMRSALALAGVFFFLPLFGLVTLLIPVFAAVEWLSLTNSTNRIFITISTSIIAIAGSCFMAISNRTGKYVTVVQILLCLLASCFLFRPYMIESDDMLYSSYLTAESTAESAKSEQSERILETLEGGSGTLNWESYHKYCLPTAKANQINMQIRCTHLDGFEIHWNGIVSDVSISRVWNWRRDLIHNCLPPFLSNALVCYLGEVNQPSCFESESCDIKEFLESQQTRCNLDKWNTYEYEIEVKTAQKGILNRHEMKVLLRGDHTFGNFTNELHPSDKIWFKGVLKTALSSTSNQPFAQKTTNNDDGPSRTLTRIDLTAIGCLQCSNKILKPYSTKSKLKMESRMKDWRRALKFLLNALLNPLVTFK